MKYYFFDIATGNGVQSSAAIEGHAADIAAAWYSLSQQSGSFLGVRCPTGDTVQFIWDDYGSVTIDIPVPNKGGSMTKQASFEECNNIIAKLCSGDGSRIIQGLEFMSW